jgi:LPXTG-motif cell wall-anchored protein
VTTAVAGLVVPVATGPIAAANPVVELCKEMVSQAENYIDTLPEVEDEGVETQGEDYTWEDATSEILDEMKGPHQGEFETYKNAWLEEPAGTEHHAKWAYRDYYQQRLTEISDWEQGGQVGPRPADPVDWKAYKPHYQSWAAEVQRLTAYEKSALRSLPVSADLSDWACAPMEQRRDNPNRPTAFSESQQRTIRVMTGNTLGKDLEQRLQQDRRAGFRTHVVTDAKPTPSLRDALRASGASHSTHQARGIPTNPRPSTTPALKPGSAPTTSAVENLAQRSGRNPAQAAEARAIERQLTGRSTRGVSFPKPGGIDWTSLELKYVTDDPENGDFGYAFSADELPDDAEEPGFDGEASLNLSSDALFTWLALDPSQFWVNLNPDTPDTIVDEQFGTTDAGRVLLEADLEMKKAFTDLSNPETELGKKHWDSLERSEDGGICYGWTRFWIEPQPATVRVDGDQLYILDAPLQVQIEPFDVDWTPPGDEYCTATTPEDMVERNTQRVVDDFEQPLEDYVNTAPEFADLRRVYTTRVAAEWIKDRDAERPGAFHDVIGSGDVSAWPARTDYDPEDVFDALMEQLETVQYTYEYEHGDLEYTLEVTGGIELPDAPRDETSKEEFERDHPRLPRTVQDARYDTVSVAPQLPAQGDVTAFDDAAAGTAWLGGGTIQQADEPDPDPPDEPGPTDPPDTPGPTDPPDRPGDGDEPGTGGGGGGDEPGRGGDRSPDTPADDPPRALPGTLPATGMDQPWMVPAAILLVLGGLVLYLLGRRRS